MWSQHGKINVMINLVTVKANEEVKRMENKNQHQCLYSSETNNNTDDVMDSYTFD